MNDVDDIANITKGLTAHLASARRSVNRARVRQLTWQALSQIATALAGVAGLTLLMAAEEFIAQPSHRWPIATIGGAMAAIAVVWTLAVATVAAIRGRSTSAEAAEALDSHLRDHNRIATALNLATDAERSAFAEAAIRDGAAWAEEHRQTRLPSRSVDSAVKRRVWVAFGVATILATATVIVDRHVRLSMATPGATPILSESLPGPSLATSTHTLTRERPPIPHHIEATEKNSAATSAASAEHSADSSAENASASASSAAQARAANAASAANSSGSTAHSAKSSPNAPLSKKAPSRRRDSLPTPSRNSTSSLADSSSATGSASGHASSSIAPPAPASPTHANSDVDSSETVDEPVDDRPEANTQRGGIQPTRRDSRPQASRELGEEKDGDQPNDGRGGPTPPKKSRGTASLVLGVPIPDTVTNSHLQPGTTRIRREQTSPREFPSPTDPTISTNVIDTRETPQDTFIVPTRTADDLRPYFIALHADRSTKDDSVNTRISGHENAQR